MRRARSFCPSAALLLIPSCLALPLLQSFTDPILGLNMGYFSDIQTSEGDALIDRNGWCSGENRIPGTLKWKSQAQKSLKVRK